MADYKRLNTALSYFSFYFKPAFLSLSVVGTVSLLCIYLLFTDDNYRPEKNNVKAKILDPNKNEYRLAVFLQELRQQYPQFAQFTEGVSVLLNDRTLYHIHSKSTFQEISLLNIKDLPSFTRQLDDNGVAYDVYQNTSDTVLLDKREWIVSWGGILYLPQLVLKSDKE